MAIQRKEEAIVQTQGLMKRFGSHVAVNGIDFEVRRGDVFGFLGPNGSGKTTTVRLLLGLLRPSAGRIQLFGQDASHHPPALLRRVGAIIETPAFYSYMTARENLHIVALASQMGLNRAMRQRVGDVLELVGLDSYPRLIARKYSLGMKQRLAIAVALLNDPELIILDEPTNGLDPEGVIEIRQLMTRLAASGKTVFLSSHLLAEVQQVCNRVVILRKGEVVLQGMVQELLRAGGQIEIRMVDPEQVQTAYEFLQQARTQQAPWMTSVAVQADKQGRPLLIVGASADQAARLNVMLVQEGLLPAEIHPRESSLEDVFLQTTSKSE